MTYKKKRFLDFIKEVFTGLLMKYSAAAAEMLNTYERNRKRNPKEGRRQPAPDIVDPQSPQPADDVGDTQPPVTVAPVVQVHQRTKKPPTASKQKPQVRCRECSFTRGVRKETMYICAVCEDSPGLCSAECFEAYHLRTQRGGVLNVQRAQVSARVQVPVAPNQILSPVANRTRGGLRRRRRATPSPVGTRTRGAKRKRSQRPPPPLSSDSSPTPSPVAETQLDSPLPATSSQVDPETGLTMLQPANPAIPVAVVAPVRKKTKKAEPVPSGSDSARRHPDGSYIGLTDSDIEDGNNQQNEGGNDRELGFDEF